MKKFLVALLTLIYLTTSSGFAIYLHYCMGKVDSVNLFKSDVCAKCGMKTSKDCCKQELKVIKLTDSHQIKSNTIDFVLPFIVLQRTSTLIYPVHPNAVDNQVTRNNSPPPSGYDLCIINNVFRI